MTLALLLAGLLAATIVGTQVLLLHGLARRQTSMAQRLADLTLRAELAQADSALAANMPGVATPGERLAPWFALPTLDGSQGSLASLLASGRPVVLSVTDPRCGPCYELLPDIAGWQRVYGDQLTFALVTSGTPAQNRAMTAEYGLDAAMILIQNDHELAEALEVPSLPAAILIDPDGRIRTPTAVGTAMVRSLVAGALGLAVPPPAGRAGEPSAVARRGDPTPVLRRPDFAGNPIDFGALRGRPTTILFWSPGCASCDELVPAIREWEERDSPMRLLIVTSGPAGLNLEAGLRSPMVPDDDRIIRMAFGVEATPSAVVVDSQGRIVTDVARGARAVRTLGDHMFDPASVRVVSAGAAGD